MTDEQIAISFGLCAVNPTTYQMRWEQDIFAALAAARAEEHARCVRLLREQLIGLYAPVIADWLEQHKPG